MKGIDYADKYTYSTTGGNSYRRSCKPGWKHEKPSTRR